MRKLIIIFSIMLLCVGLFGCSASGDLKIPSTLELKDEYRNDVSVNFMDNFNKCSALSFEMYKNIENITKDYSDKSHTVTQALLASKEGTKLTESELFLSSKVGKLQFDILFYSIGANSEKDKLEIEEDLKMVLDLYK